MAYQNMIAVFVDVIGYKNTTDFERKYELHRLFHEEVAVHEKRQLAIPHVIYDRKVFGFSDCAYFFFYYKDGIEKERKNDIRLAHIAAYNVSLTILLLMSKGYLARGGLAIGNVFIDDLGFFGPAVERAHEIESREAKVPRLQFDCDIGRQVYEWEHDVSRKDPNLISLYTDIPYVSELENESYFVNPFYVLQISGAFLIGAENLTIESVKNTVLGKVGKDLMTHAADSKIVEKLEWIKQYTSSKKNLLKPELVNSSFSLMNAYTHAS